MSSIRQVETETESIATSNINQSIKSLTKGGTGRNYYSGEKINSANTDWQYIFFKIREEKCEKRICVCGY